MPISDDAYSPGDVVVVPFPFSDRLAEKRRPALVVSGAAVLEAGLVWIAMITSARNGAIPGDMPIEDLPRSGLARSSTIRPVKVACIDQDRILRRIGVLPDADADAVFRRIRSMIGPS